MAPSLANAYREPVRLAAVEECEQFVQWPHSRTTCQGPESSSREQVKKKKGREEIHMSRNCSNGCISISISIETRSIWCLREGQMKCHFSDSGRARLAASLSLFCLSQTISSPLPFSYSLQQYTISVDSESKLQIKNFNYQICQPVFRWQHLSTSNRQTAARCAGRALKPRAVSTLPNTP